MWRCSACTGKGRQGLLLRLSLASHKVWLFQFWFEKFAWGLVAGFVLGFAACLAFARRGPAYPKNR